MCVSGLKNTDPIHVGKVKERKLTCSLQNQRKSGTASRDSSDNKLDQGCDQSLTDIVFAPTTSMTPVENWTTKDENSSDTIPEDANNHYAAQEKGDENSTASLYSSDSKLDQGCDKSLTKIVFVSLRSTQLKGTLDDRRAATGPPRVSDPSFSLETKLHGSPARTPIKIFELPSPEPFLSGAESAKTRLLAETSFPDRKPASGGPPRVVTPTLSSETEFHTSSARAPNKISSFPPQGPTQQGEESAKTRLLAKTSFTDRNLACQPLPRADSWTFSSETEFRASSESGPNIFWHCCSDLSPHRVLFCYHL